jgi:hypothetical protein
MGGPQEHSFIVSLVAGFEQLAPYQLEAGKNTTKQHAVAFGIRCLTNSPANLNLAGHFKRRAPCREDLPQGHWSSCVR